MTHSSAGTTVRGLKALGQFMQSERSRFAAAPIVLIASQAAKDRSIQQIDDAVRRTNFLLQQELGFRTLLFHSVNVFPTVNDVQVAKELVGRVGASTIAAAGSGSAMDLAKAVCQACDLDELVLVPATYGASLAAASPHSLVLDPIEEALLAHPVQHQPTPRRISTLVTLTRDLFRTESREESLFTAISIALDHVYRGTADDKIEALLERAIQCLELGTGAEHDDIAEIMSTAGNSISFGLGDANRSIPLALVASLIPTSFPQYSATTFMASIVPALCQTLERQNKSLELIQRIPVLSAPTIVTNDSSQTLLSQIHSSQALWNCLDATDDDFRTVLSNHLLVS